MSVSLNSKLVVLTDLLRDREFFEDLTKATIISPEKQVYVKCHTVIQFLVSLGTF